MFQLDNKHNDDEPPEPPQAKRGKDGLTPTDRLYKIRIFLGFMNNNLEKLNMYITQLQSIL